MNMSYQNQINKQLNVLELSDKPKLIISKELQSEIMCLHARIGDVEWSGPLYYKVISGNINSPSSLVIKALRVCPYDCGTAASTEFEQDERIMEFFTTYPECDPTTGAKWGVIHTHHSMTTFFSGTDSGELHDHAEAHNYYLSLIVNHKSQFMAKIALVANRTIKTTGIAEDFITFKGSNGEAKIDLVAEETKDSIEKILVTMDCEISFEQDDFFKAKIDEITKPKTYNYPKPSYTPKHTQDREIGFNRQAKLDFDDGYGGWGEDWDDNLGWTKREKYNKPITINDNSINKPSIHNDLDSLKVKTFLIKWISQDYTCEDKLSEVLKLANSNSRGKVLDHYLNNLDRNIKPYFGNVFDVDYQNISDMEVEKLAIQCITELKKYVSGYMIVEDIINLLDLYVVEETNDFIVNSWNK